eukprot:2143086-Alexandrium_andersonii.AAC.1
MGSSLVRGGLCRWRLRHPASWPQAAAYSSVVATQARLWLSVLVTSGRSLCGYRGAAVPSSVRRRASAAARRGASRGRLWRGASCGLAAA